MIIILIKMTSSLLQTLLSKGVAELGLQTVPVHIWFMATVIWYPILYCGGSEVYL